MSKKFPVSICGLALGFAALGNLLGAYSETFRYVCGSIAFFIALGFTARVVTDFSSLRKELENPVAFSVLPAYTMTLILLAVYIKPFLKTAAFAVWVPALILQFIIIAAFIKTFVAKFNIRQVFPSWFVMFVGIVTASVTSPAMGMKPVGQAIFYIGFLFYLALLPVVIYRTIKISEIPEPARPATAIFSAPASLCTVGYISAFDEKNIALVIFIAALSLIFWLAILFSAFKFLKLPFFPSYSAFTFPMVISAIAFKAAGTFLSGSMGILFRFLSTPATLIAAAVTFYVLVRYCMFWLVLPQLEAHNLSIKD